jgi:aspartate/methionine/tyrosine aminotransferase
VHRVPRPAALAPDLSVLTFNGISKLLALPDLKLGWILVSGPTDGGRRREIAERLELANDMFLNAGGPAQHVTTALLPEREHYLGDARRRIAAARRALISAVAEVPGLELLPPEGGIHAVLRLPPGLSTTDEEFAVTLVREYGIELHPGYLYGMDDDRSLVLSLLPGETALTGRSCRNVDEARPSRRGVP